MTDFLLKAVLISLSGVMAPGPITAATLAAGSRRRHAGLMIALGHALIEVPLILLLAAGVAEFLETRRATIAAVVGLTGGLFLLWMGVQGLRDLRRPASTTEPAAQGHPLGTGVVLTVANPYFLMWWATVGLTFVTQGVQLGVWALGLFIVCHWLCDLVWLEILSITSFQGANLLGGGRAKAILAVCASVLLVFGCKFVYDAIALTVWGSP